MGAKILPIFLPSVLDGRESRIDQLNECGYVFQTAAEIRQLVAKNPLSNKWYVLDIALNIFASITAALKNRFEENVLFQSTNSLNRQLDFCQNVHALIFVQFGIL